MTTALTRTPPPPHLTPEQRRRRRLRRRAIRRRRAVAVLALVTIVTGLAYLASRLAGPPHHRSSAGAAPPAQTTARAPFPVAELDATYVDRTRSMSLPGGGRAPRRLVTRILYPVAPAGRRLPTPLPLVVFGHGYALYPRVYWSLLTAWARAGYVVAAPVFPLENAGAPGGPTHADESNEPADISYVISRVLAAGAAGASPLHGLIDGRAIAVAGHSDGGDAALAVAEGLNRDHRISAALVLAGATLPGLELDSGGPPLLAAAGSADHVTPPSVTDAFFAALGAPKFRLTLLGAAHTAPYSRRGPELGVVERVTLAFLDRYVKGERVAAARLAASASVPGIAALTSDP